MSGKSNPHIRRWQLQEAKESLSEVVRLALEEGPQTITIRGKDTVVVAAVSDNTPEEPATLWDLLRPLKGLKIPTSRNSATSR
jgi:prevent-host-death family protein